MQKATLYAIFAPIVYALANVVLEHKLSKYNNLTLMVIYCAVILGLASIMRLFVKDVGGSSQILGFPAGGDLFFLVLLGCIFFVADYFFVGAYTNGGDLVTITILTLLFPVFASLFKFAGSFFIKGMVHTPPNMWQICGYLLAVLAVLLVVRGSLGTTLK